MYKLILNYHFDASHHLLNYDGACANQHGHRWNVRVFIKTKELRHDMVIDFKVIKGIIDEYDHIDINDKFPDLNPTAENIAKKLHNDLCEDCFLNRKDVKITIWESPDASITYTE